jgi:hypothetical protein
METERLTMTVSEAAEGEVGRWVGGAGAADGLSPVGFPSGACVPSRLGVNLASGPLSNRACGSPAHGFPTPFIVRHALVSIV